MTSSVKQLRSNTIDIQILAEEHFDLEEEISLEDIELILRRRILLAYPSAHKFSSLIKEILDQNTILYRLYAKVTIPIDKATKQMFEFNPVPKTRFEAIIDDME
ncbi:hypothetical protein CMI41_01075 [Candidatus Pacearchaeota archaeon]|nr:hypothetical protein [Candidatus Pacearchaeota archaeon]|tara:strand:- start:4278 stop:4589 length:312 start_codon:yes stop_codon:yes gene_type:complete